MHGVLLERVPVLSLAPDSIASLGELDANSLSDLWGVFTKCKETLQNGRRLENLSWRLWFESERRELAAAKLGSTTPAPVDLEASKTPNGLEAVQQGEWSDPEWTASESDDDDNGDQPQLASNMPNGQRRPSYNRADSSKRTIGSNAAASSAVTTTDVRSVARPSLTGGSLQRMITDLTSLPAIAGRSKAKSAADVPAATEMLPVPTPLPPSRGSSAPEALPSMPSPPVRGSAPVVASTSSSPSSSKSRSTTPTSSLRNKQIVSPTSLHKQALSSSSAMKTKTLPAPAPAPPVGQKCVAPKAAGAKNMFFIKSPNSDSDDETPSPPKVRMAAAHASIATSPLQNETKFGQGNQAEEEDDWDDEDSDSGSSDWESDGSDESDDEVEPKRNGGPARPTGAFVKRASVGAPGDLKPRGPGLLSQLFHPDLLTENNRSHSITEMQRVQTMPQIQRMNGSKSTNNLAAQDRSRNPSFLKGRPDDVEMESSSEEEDERESAHASHHVNNRDGMHANGNANNAVAAALARHQAKAAEQRKRDEISAAIAVPQSPRTTRRAMLATELSESLRRNLLWERQTRNRILGGPINTRFQPVQPAPPPVVQTTQSAQGVFERPGAVSRVSQEGPKAPQPSPATRVTPPAKVEGRNQPMVRRHTVGTGLYLEAQRNRWPSMTPTLDGKGRLRKSSDSSESESEEEEEEEEEGTQSGQKDVYRSAFDHGLHSHGW